MFGSVMVYSDSVLGYYEFTLDDGKLTPVSFGGIDMKGGDEE